MFVRLLLCSLFLITATSVSATERFLMAFTLTQDGKIIEQGKSLVSQKQHTWSKGLKRSYLQLRCQQQGSGEMKKLFSTVDHFKGMLVTHQLVNKNVELTVVKNLVKPRLTDIRSLAKTECKNISPVLNTTTQTYSFPAKDGANESLPFGENMTFNSTFQSVGKTL